MVVIVTPLKRINTEQDIIELQSFETQKSSYIDTIQPLLAQQQIAFDEMCIEYLEKLKSALKEKVRKI